MKKGDRGGRKRPSYGCFREAPSAKNFLGKTPEIHVFSCRDPYRVYLRDVWSDFLDIRGTRTPGRPLRNSVKLERSPRGNIPYGRYANTPRAKEMLENHPPPPYTYRYNYEMPRYRTPISKGHVPRDVPSRM